LALQSGDASASTRTWRRQRAAILQDHALDLLLLRRMQRRAAGEEQDDGTRKEGEQSVVLIITFTCDGVWPWLSILSICALLAALTTSTASISTATPFGNDATPTAARAGYGSLKYCAITSLTSAKFPQVSQVNIDLDRVL